MRQPETVSELLIPAPESWIMLGSLSCAHTPIFATVGQYSQKEFRIKIWTNQEILTKDGFPQRSSTAQEVSVENKQKSRLRTGTVLVGTTNQKVSETMAQDLDVDIDTILLEDDASKYKETLTLVERRALYHPNGLIEGPTGLSDEERQVVSNLLSPDRPGFEEAMQGVLK